MRKIKFYMALIRSGLYEEFIRCIEMKKSTNN